MKIAILSAVNIRHMSMVVQYIESINATANNIDLIYFDKYDIHENISGVNKIKYTYIIDENWTFYKKIKIYLKFKKYATSILKNNDYDYIIVWGSYTAHLFGNILIKNFSNRYIVNIRDYFYEKNILINRRFEKIIKHSLLTILSSEKYKSFLPAYDNYRILHSINLELLKNAEINNKFNLKFPLKIYYIGHIRFHEELYKFIEVFKNDYRFELYFIGTGSKKLNNYLNNFSIKNVFVKEGFDIKDTYKFLNKADILFNVYGNNNISLDTAISIRFYYSIYLRKPLLTSPETYTSELARGLGLGFDIIYEKSSDLMKEDLIRWYSNLEMNEIKSNTDQWMKNILNNNEQIFNELNKIISQEYYYE